jgi:hypothetical protein
MRSAAPRLAAAAVAWLLATGTARAADRPWYAPDQAKLQLAGSIGFLSPGVGWGWLDRRLEADLFFGWVPPPLGGEHIFSLTSKLTLRPFRVTWGAWELRPVTAALQLTYTFGDDYWVLLPDDYPDGYYVLPTALRSGLAIGTDVGRPLWGFERVGAYAELVVIDTALKLWADNRRALDLTDVVTLALGVRVEL